MHLVVIGDIHTQAAKLWTMLQSAGLADAKRRPTERFRDPNIRLILLGDLVHAKSREQYGALAGVRTYDEHNPQHLAKAEKAQVDFLREVKAFQDAVGERMIILMGNHDFNAVSDEQGPLRTDDISHLEWTNGYGSELDRELRTWISNWPFQTVIDDIHFAHVGPRAEHNRYDSGFYLENRRRWIYENRDFLAETPYRLGVYGHTPVRGGVNVASQGRAILLDTNGHGEEWCYLTVDTFEQNYRLRMRGLFFDEIMKR